MTAYFKLISVLICLCITSFAAPAAAADVSVGLGAAWQSSPYKGHDDTILPAPLIHIEGDRLYLRGPDAGIHILKNEAHEFSLGASLSGLSFDSDKTDDRGLKKLNNRHSTLNAYLQYALQSDYGRAGLRVTHDVLGNSQAASAEAFYKYPLTLGPVYVSPGVGLRWDSAKQLGYYYGISPGEARKSGLDKYSPDAGVSPFLSLESDWKLADSWSLTAAGSVLFLSREITDSPMVDDSQIFNMTIGVKYTL